MSVLQSQLKRAHARQDIVGVETAPVYEGDDFAFEYGLDPHLHHTPKGVTPNLTHAWAIVHRRVGNTTVRLFSVAAVAEVSSWTHEERMDEEKLQTLALNRVLYLLPDEEVSDETE